MMSHCVKWDAAQSNLTGILRQSHTRRGRKIKVKASEHLCLLDLVWWWIGLCCELALKTPDFLYIYIIYIYFLYVGIYIYIYISQLLLQLLWAEATTAFSLPVFSSGTSDAARKGIVGCISLQPSRKWGASNDQISDCWKSMKIAVSKGEHETLIWKRDMGRDGCSRNTTSMTDIYKSWLASHRGRGK